MLTFKLFVQIVCPWAHVEISAVRGARRVFSTYESLFNELEVNSKDKETKVRLSVKVRLNRSK